MCPVAFVGELDLTGAWGDTFPECASGYHLGETALLGAGDGGARAICELSFSFAQWLSLPPEGWFKPHDAGAEALSVGSELTPFLCVLHPLPAMVHIPRVE